MLKKLVLFVAAVMLLASSVQAAINDVQPSGEHAFLVPGVCGGAGALSFVFDQGTVLDNSAEILVTLTKGEFCKDIDLFVNGTAASLPANDKVGPLQGNGTIAGGNFIMHVKNVSSTVLRLKVLGPGTATAGPGGLKLKLFDNTAAKTNDELLIGRWDAGAGKLVDISNDTAAHNSWCVKVDGAEGDLVQVALTSVPQVYTFTNSIPPTVAVLKGASTVSVVKKVATPSWEIPTGEQSSCSVNFETDAMCGFTPPSVTNRFFALQNGADYPTGDYSVTLELLVNGASGDNGVYFEAQSQGFQFTSLKSDLVGAFGPNKAASDTEFYLGSGAKTSRAPVVGCERKDDEKITKMTFKVVGVDNTVKGETYLRVNVPSVAVTKPSAGDAVAIKVTIEQGRCSTLYAGTFPLFTAVAKCHTGAPTATLLFPYFADAPFWNGMALTNIGTAPVNASLAIVDEKGGKGSIDIVVPANGMYVNLVEKIIADSAFNGTVDATKRCYIIVTPQSGSLTGFAMMGNAGESMGYTVNN